MEASTPFEHYRFSVMAPYTYTTFDHFSEKYCWYMERRMKISKCEKWRKKSKRPLTPSVLVLRGWDSGYRKYHFSILSTFFDSFKSIVDIWRLSHRSTHRNEESSVPPFLPLMNQSDSTRHFATGSNWPHSGNDNTVGLTLPQQQRMLYHPLR